MLQLYQCSAIASPVEAQNRMIIASVLPISALFMWIFDFLAYFIDDMLTASRNPVEPISKVPAFCAYELFHALPGAAERPQMVIFIPVKITQIEDVENIRHAPWCFLCG